MLAALASAGLLGAAKTVGFSEDGPKAEAVAEPPRPAALLPPPSPTPRGGPPGGSRGGLPRPPPPRLGVGVRGGGELSKLPGDGDLLALTVDDGTNSEVVRLYTQFARDTGIRLTFFANGVYDSWRDNAAALRPLVESGQIQMANHTWSHPDLTTLSSAQVAEQLQRNHRFLRDTFGVDAAPYFRPPYGNHNADVDAVAADLGYRVPTLWSGSLADSKEVTEDFIVSMANQYFQPQTIVIGHLNHLPVTHVFGALADIIRSRNLRTVTLNDVFLQPEIPFRATI